MTIKKDLNQCIATLTGFLRMITIILSLCLGHERFKILTRLISANHGLSKHAAMRPKADANFRAWSRNIFHCSRKFSANSTIICFPQLWWGCSKVKTRVWIKKNCFTSSFEISSKTFLYKRLNQFGGKWIKYWFLKRDDLK